LQTFSQVANSEPKSESEKNFAKLQQSIATLQNENDAVKGKTLALQKINNGLETSLQKYVSLFSEEKNEKKEWVEKYDHLQNNYHNVAKKYYLFLGITIVLVAILAFVFAPKMGALIADF